MTDTLGTVALSLLLPIALGIVGIVVSYVVIRMGVAAGLRDYLKWIERNRPSHAAHLRGEHPTHQ